MNMTALAAGLAAVQDRLYFEETVDKIIVTRENTKRELARLGFEYLDSETNFIFARPPKGLQAAALFERLKEHDIYVRYFPKPRLSEYLRITIGTDEEMQKFVQVLEEILA